MIRKTKTRITDTRIRLPNLYTPMSEKRSFILKKELKPHEKFYITIEEAIVYYHMSRAKIYELLEIFADENIVAKVGRKQLIVRHKLDKILLEREIAI